jgi:preprotein translocase subunit YajC
MFKYLKVTAATVALIVAATGCSAASAPTPTTVPTEAAAVPAVSAASPGSPVAGNGTPTGNRASRGPGVSGTVQAVNGSMITVQTRQNNTTVTVQINSDTTILRQTTETIAQVKSGDTIFALGQLSGDVVQARQIRLNATPGAGRPNGAVGNPAGPATPAAGAPAGLKAVTGTVDSVSTDTITVKAADGSSVKVQLAANGRITNQTTATAADIIAGKFLTVAGQMQGTTLVATSVNLTDPPATG